MLFRTAASIALLACTAHAATGVVLEPYKLAKMHMPVSGMSLARRDTPGYEPEITSCQGEGTTCAEVCGKGYQECPSEDDDTHCFSPDKKQSCCTDGSGNSCDEGYYCTHDTDSQTMCCPDDMDLAACAAAYSVSGGLEAATSTTASSTSTSTSTSTTSEIKTTAKPTTTSKAETTSEAEVETTTEEEPTSTEEPTTTKEKSSKSTPVTHSTKTAEEKEESSTPIHTPTPSNGNRNSTAPTGSSGSGSGSEPTGTSGTNPPVETGAAALTSVSGLLLAVAGVFALL